MLPLPLLGLLLGALVLAGGCWYWRWRCQKKSIPWPYQLAFWLENPFMVVFCNKDQLAQRLVALLPSQAKAQGVEKPSCERPLKVLDLGCGAGRILVPVAKLCSNATRITAMDMQPEMLAKAAAACRQEGINHVQFKLLTLHPPYGEALGRFDLIYLVTVLGEIPKLAEVLGLLYRSLSPGGNLSITETLPDPCYLPSRSVQRAGEEAGLTVRATRHGIMSYTIEFAKLS